MQDGAHLIAGRYRLVERLALGGMGTVWEGWDERLHRPVAIKQLHAQPGLSPVEAELANNRAMREARITARLHHAHAVPVYDVVDSDGSPCLIMQFLPSKSLQQVVNEKGVLQPTVVARIGSEIASALAAAHLAGIVHRDVKPGNILIAEDGAAKITDFGISHALGDVTLTTTGMLTGTPAYLAPEVARGELSGPASDVFSLGATLYLALEGTPPFGADKNPMALLHRIALGQMVPPQRSGELTPLLMQMLSSDPVDRPPMIDVASRLAKVQAGSATTTAPMRAPGKHPAQTFGPPAAPAPPTEIFARPAPPQRREPQRREPQRREPQRREPRRPRGGLVALLAVLVVAGLALVIGLLVLGNSGSGAPSADQTRSAIPRHTTPAATARITPTSSATSHSSSSRSTSSRSTSSSPATASSGGNSGKAATPGQLASAVTDYYGLLPGGTDQGWARLTTQYQQSHAGGRGAYDRFWAAMTKVDIGSVVAGGANRVIATISYHRRSGQIVDERTAFTLVRDKGILKIADSQVLSSSTR